MPSIGAMEVLDPEYYYHKSVLFPIQMKDLFIKSRFELVVAEIEEKIDSLRYFARADGIYLCKKIDSNIRWKNDC